MPRPALPVTSARVSVLEELLSAKPEVRRDGLRKLRPGDWEQLLADLRAGERLYLVCRGKVRTDTIFMIDCTDKDWPALFPSGDEPLGHYAMTSGIHGSLIS